MAKKRGKSQRKRLKKRKKRMRSSIQAKPGYRDEEQKREKPGIKSYERFQKHGYLPGEDPQETLDTELIKKEEEKRRP